MGGLSTWNVLNDSDLSSAMPEVFAPPPEIVSSYMEDEVKQALIDWNSIVAEVIHRRGLFGSAPRVQPEGLLRVRPIRSAVSFDGSCGTACSTTLAENSQQQALVRASGWTRSKLSMI
jgi:hypothetical protein